MKIENPFFKEFIQLLDFDVTETVEEIIKANLTDEEFDEVRADDDKFQSLLENKFGRLIAVLTLYSITNQYFSYKDFDEWNSFDDLFMRLEFKEHRERAENVLEICVNVLSELNNFENYCLDDYLLFELQHWNLIQVVKVPILKSYNEEITIKANEMLEKLGIEGKKCERPDNIQTFYEKEYEVTDYSEIKVPIITPVDAEYLIGLLLDTTKKRSVKFGELRGYFKTVQSILKISDYFNVENLDLTRFKRARANKFHLETVQDLVTSMSDDAEEKSIPYILALLFNEAVRFHGMTKYEEFTGELQHLIVETAMNQTNNFKDWGKIAWKDNYIGFIEYLENAVRTNNWFVDTQKYDKYSPLYNVLPSPYINNDFFTYNESGKYLNNEELEELYMKYSTDIENLRMFTAVEKAIIINEYFENLSNEHKGGILFGRMGAEESFKTYVKRNK